MLLTSEIRFEDTQKNTRPYIPFDGIPFVIIGKKVFACHHGKDRHAREKQTKNPEEPVTIFKCHLKKKY